MTEKELLNKFADGIEDMTGYRKTPRNGIPNVAQRLNNPGCLERWMDPAGNPYPDHYGAAEFPDYKTGRRALVAQCKINIVRRGLSWREFFAGKPGLYRGFSPRDDGSRRLMVVGEGKNDPIADAYRVMNFVCAPLGIETTIETPIITLVDGYRVPAIAMPKAA